MVAVAIGGSAIIGAGASIIGGNSAAHAQEHASEASIAEQRREYDLERSDYAPWRAAGASAVGRLQQAYGLAPSDQPYGGFFTSPGYNFRLSEGLKAIDRGAAARGILGSGATTRAEQRYGEGLAASE